MSVRNRVCGVAALLALAGCGERAQVLDTSGKKVDEPAWAVSSSADPAFAARGWKAGDKAAWTEQIRQRTQAQNDYVR